MGLTLDRVTKTFAGVPAVNELSLQIPEGEIFGLLGANGAGKTTTFRVIIGLLEASKGNVFWNEKKVHYYKSNYIGYLPEERGLYPKLKVKEQLIYLGRLRGMKKTEIVKELESWLERFRIPDYMNQRVEELSKGNQQKIQFISAVLHKPNLLILDEPFSGLDPVNVELLKQAVVELKERGTSIVFSSHRMEHVEELCKHLCILEKGKPIVQGELAEIKRSFGKKNLRIHADFDLTYLKNAPGVVKYHPVNDGCTLQIEDEDAAKQVFHTLYEKGFVRKFELEEPSLNDIFIEKAGTSYE
ncbi:ATP-binding cassette domain-containing protein [Salibacterium salarium]|uniref:ATP-binding cassette domain-containing protein n=1 Tax=Salibacterium salarium TaxID=284579 RepID=A0A428N4E6_9BACI|nr:ABC transporter ATP-binding protein [Salibacterium salarium]RSL33355.1 ATP-binding cassette domain-containing protein [Salibacterium salarium]